MFERSMPGNVLFGRPLVLGREDHKKEFDNILQGQWADHPKGYSFSFAMDRISASSPNLVEDLERIKDRAANIKRSHPNFISRIPIVLDLGGTPGYAMIDISGSPDSPVKCVLGEPSGRTNPDVLKHLQTIQTAIRQVFQTNQIHVSQKILRSNEYSYDDARIVAKVLGYLAKSQQGIFEAINNEEEIRKLTINSDEKSHALYVEGCKKNDEANACQSDPKKVFAPLVREMGIGVPVDNEVDLYRMLSNGFQTRDVLKPTNLVEIYRQANEATQNSFKNLINSFLRESPARMDYYSKEVSKLIPALTINYINRPQPAARPADNMRASATTDTPFTKNLGTQELINHFRGEHFVVSTSDANKTMTLKKNENTPDPKIIQIKKLEDQKLQFTTACKKVDELLDFAKAIQKCVDRGTALNIDVKGGKDEAERVKARCFIWLNAVNNGYKVANYQPPEEWLSRHRDDLSPEAQNEYLPQRDAPRL